MEAFKKKTTESYELKVISSFEEKWDYFLRNFAVQGYSEQLDFLWVKQKKIRASISFAISKDGEACSLPQSPFGGFWLEENLNSEALERFIRAVVMEFSKRGIFQLSITEAPKPYGQSNDLVNYLLFKCGFEQKEVVSHQFFIGRKKIKKLVLKERPGFVIKENEAGVNVIYGQIQNFGFLKEIKSWNIQRGYEVNLDENRIIQQVSVFPDRYFLITILKNNEPVGYSLGVKLTSNSLYYYLSATNPKVSLKNGGELLLHELFQIAVEQKVDFIDLGSSDLETSANHGLMFFKSRFANDISNKITWTFKN
ncbi:MAG: hypothetical protein PSV36_05270 [Algoriphagus sp.]|nr:hypothetical protein [Algoriphagus sp.]